ncbi:MAG: Gfo/Idh/MocA family oxidoreductase [Bacteroides sp.]|nr:Gfo/Idh/MocA family oxidoreductase [Prevotella sp.]MCM1408779.1 Gfo/Idh/MocA family oxidoreductase [Treponema brennaborense]MCM1470694.1 Gfo/Idh/MocA family oxidoreductase [Bacteroides sp.]
MKDFEKPVYTAALVGTGRIGYTLAFDKKREQPASHTAAFDANHRIRLIAACDIRKESLEDWGRKHKNAALYDSASELARQEHPDIIAVAVNEDSHLSVFRDAARCRPRLIILEKPVALSAAEGTEIRRIAESYDIPVLVNHERRFAADYALAKQWLAKIGDIQTAAASLWSGLRVYSAAEEKTGLYSLLHDGTHLVDTVRYLLDAEFANPAVFGIHSDSSGNVRNIQVSYSVPQCPAVQFSFSGRSKYFGFDIDIHGTEGRIQIGNGYARLFLRKKSKLYSGFYSLALVKTKIPKKTGYFANMTQHAVDFLDGACPLRSSLESGLKTLAVLEEIKAVCRSL